MKVIYTFTELEGWNKDSECDFCANFDIAPIKATKQIKARNIETNRLLGGDSICDDCQERFNNNQIEKCDRCGKLYRKSIDFWQGRYSCNCETRKEQEQEVEPERYSTQLEKQIHDLNIDKEELEEELEQEREHHLAGIGASAHFHKSQHEEETKLLKDKSRRLSNENKKLKIKLEELEKEINKLSLENGTLKNGFSILKSQILQVGNNIEEYEAHIEVPPKQ